MEDSIELLMYGKNFEGSTVIELVGNFAGNKWVHRARPTSHISSLYVKLELDYT
jgi:hypothetical protein